MGIPKSRFNEEGMRKLGYRPCSEQEAFENIAREANREPTKPGKSGKGSDEAKARMAKAREAKKRKGRNDVEQTKDNERPASAEGAEQAEP